MPYWAKKSTWKLDNGPKHTPSNRERCFGHFCVPSRCHSRSRLVQKWVIYGSKIAKNDRMPYWAKNSTWKLDNGPKIIHLHHAGQDGPFSSTQWYCASNHSFTQTSWTTMACLINMNRSIWNPKVELERYIILPHNDNNLKLLVKKVKYTTEDWSRNTYLLFKALTMF